jgi:hypothetical protein
MNTNINNKNNGKYICEKCNKNFNYNYLLERHLKRKNPCVSLNNLLVNYNQDILEIDNKINDLIRESIKSNNMCKFCNHSFSKKGNLERHINISCIEKKALLEKKCIIQDKKNKIESEIYQQQIYKNSKNIEQTQHINKLENEIDMLKKTVEKLLKEQSSKQQNNNIMFQQIINNVGENNIPNINSFGKENLTHISENDYKKYMSGFFPGFVNFIKKIHFDDGMPENHNIYFTNLNSKYLYIYEDNKWITQQKNDIIDKLINKKFILLDNKCEEYEDKEINLETINKFREFQENFTDLEAQKNTKNDVMLLLYNNRDKPEKIKKLQANTLNIE